MAGYKNAKTDETVIARRLDDLKEKFKAQTGHGIELRSATLEDYISVPSCLESWSSAHFPMLAKVPSSI